MVALPRFLAVVSKRENDALPVRATEAVMGAAPNQEKTTR
jgi:hypothetical protein